MGYLGGPVVDAAAAAVRAPLPAGPPGAAVRARVRDVLADSGRVLDGEESAVFARFRRALEIMEETAARFPPLADLLMIVAGQSLGAADLLAGRPWDRPERRFVTFVFQGKLLRCPRTGGCRLRTACRSCPFPAASGVTLEDPAAVYAADASARRVCDEVAAVRLAATLVHEYTHVALRRMYGNASLPWFEREPAAPEEVDARIRRLRAHRDLRISILMDVFDGMKPVRIPDAEPNPEVRGYLVDIAADWCGYPSGARLRYQESVSYIMEAYFHAYRLRRPDAVELLYGMSAGADPFLGTDPFGHWIVPDLADLAAVVRGRGVLADR